MAKQDETGPDNPKAANAHGAAEVQAKMDEDLEQGFHGVKVDPTPNVNYTVHGVTRGLPTPETSAEQYAVAEAHGRKIAKRFGANA